MSPTNTNDIVEHRAIEIAEEQRTQIVAACRQEAATRGVSPGDFDEIIRLLQEHGIVGSLGNTSADDADDAVEAFHHANVMSYMRENSVTYERALEIVDPVKARQAKREQLHHELAIEYLRRNPGVSYADAERMTAR